MPDLNPDGPHSPERTAEVAALLDACSRYLVYASMPEKGGLEYPSEVYRLLGEIYSATSRLPQVCTQLAAFLQARLDSGKLGDDTGNDPGMTVNAALYHLRAAASRAADLTTALQSVQAAISRLHAKESADG